MSQSEVRTDQPAGTNESTSVYAAAEAALKAGRTELVSVREKLEEEIRHNPDNYKALDFEVQVLVRLDEEKLAQKLLEEYIRYFPENGEASSRLAWLFWQEGKSEEAIAEVRATLSRQEDCDSARRWLVEWAYERKDYHLSHRESKVGLKYHPDSEHYLYYRALSASHLGDESVARYAFQELLEKVEEPEEAIRAYSEFLLDLNHSGEAYQLLYPYIQEKEASPALRLRAIDAAFRARNHKEALLAAADLLLSEEADNEETQNELFNLCQDNMGLAGFESWAFEKLEKLKARDCFALTLLERCGMRGNRGNVLRVYKLISAYPLHYPKSMARFLSTYYDQPLVPGTISRWVEGHHDDIQSNITLWGGVGAWYISRQKWESAIHHLSVYPEKKNVKPWMIFLLCQAYEAKGMITEANHHYRVALSYPSDHSELMIRAQLAFNMAMDGLASAGKVILSDIPDKKENLWRPVDLLRVVAVQSLAEAELYQSIDQLRHVFETAMEQMHGLKKEHSAKEGSEIIRGFRKRMMEILSLKQS